MGVKGGGDSAGKVQKEMEEAPEFGGGGGHFTLHG